MRFTLEEFKEKLKGLPYVCLSEKYINARTKLKFQCLNCNHVFESTPDNILHGHNCPYCSKHHTFTKEEIINKLNDKYVVKNIDFKTNKDYVFLSCKKHGNFKITSTRIMQGKGCPTCAKEKAQKHKTNKQYLSELKVLNLDRIYDFSKVNYVNAKTPVIVICKKCGKEFSKNPRVFFRKTAKACPYCNYYIGERLVEDYLIEHKIKFIAQYSFKNTEISRLRFDFYLPDLNIVIEYQGEQHYRAVSYWGGEKRFAQQQKNDQRKRDFCKENNIQEIEISYKENVIDVLDKLFYNK